MKYIYIVAIVLSLSACAVRKQEVECTPLGGVSTTTTTTYSIDQTTEEKEYALVSCN